MRLDERLIGKKTTDGKIDFHEHISRVREEASSWLEVIEKNGIDHSKRLEDYLDRLIPDEFKKKLKPAEVFILLYAVYLHDIGYRNEQGEIESHDHPLRSKNYILKDPKKYLFDQFPPMKEGEAPLAAQAVAEVCYGHAPESICPLDNINDKFPDQYLCEETLNLRLLAALLRLADEMDQPYMRLGHFRKHISLVEIGTDIVRWYWEDLGKDAGAGLEKQVQKTEKALREANSYLYPWGLPPRTIVLKPSLLDVVSPLREPIDSEKYIPKYYIPSRYHDEHDESGGDNAAGIKKREAEVKAAPTTTPTSTFPKVMWLTGREIMKKYDLSAIELYQYIKNGLSVYSKDFSEIMLEDEAQPLTEYDIGFEIDFDINHSEEMYDYLKGYHFKVSEVEEYLNSERRST